ELLPVQGSHPQLLFRRMEHLNLRHCSGFGVDAMRALTELFECTTMKRLYIGNSFDHASSVDDNTALRVALANFLAQCGRSLEVLDLENFAFFDDSMAESLSTSCKSLTKLIVSGTLITITGLKVLTAMTTLRELAADYCIHL